MSNISLIRVGSTVPCTAVPTNIPKIKEKIISELFKKETIMKYSKNYLLLILAMKNYRS